PGQGATLGTARIRSPFNARGRTRAAALTRGGAHPRRFMGEDDATALRGSRGSSCPARADAPLPPRDHARQCRLERAALDVGCFGSGSARYGVFAARIISAWIAS